MSKELLINVSEGEECRIALIDNGKLEELYMERTSATSHVGNIYKGRVTNVEPSIQAAFVDFGLGRNGFLHISDLLPSYFGHSGEEFTEAVGRKLSRRDRPPIQRCLRRGDDITVQIIKEGIGTKGPTLSTYLSIPGRILVMMPGMSKFGISRKIEDEGERRRLRTILDQLKPIEDVGFIIRTAGVDKTKTEIERDLKYLTRLWENIKKMMKKPAPIELYTEGDLVTRTVRDVFTADVEQLIVDNKDVAKRIKEFFKIAMPRTKNRVELYEDAIPLFHKYGIEQEIERMYTRHVPLPSGGSLVIDSTEAVVAIDVNSGKFRDHSDAETTAYKTDMEAADEIARQLRLRDLGGVIICDFIDLRFERHRRDLELKLHNNLKRDRAKTKVLRMSQFGIIEMTRQRMRPSLKRSIYFDCPHCHGSGLVKTPESMSLDVMRKLAIAVNDQRVARVEVAVCPDVALYLLNKNRAQLSDLEAKSKKRIIVRQDQRLALDDLRLELLDGRDGAVYIESLGMNPNDALLPTTATHGNKPDTRRGGRGGGRDNRPPRQQQPPHPRAQRPPEPQSDERYDFESDNHRDADEPQGQSPRVDEDQEESVKPPEPRGRGRGRSRGPAPADLEAEEIPESENVVEIDDAEEPIGDAPGEVEDDRPNRPRQNSQQDSRQEPRQEGNGRGRRRRGRRGRGGRGRDDERQPNDFPINKPAMESNDESIGNVRKPEVDESDVAPGDDESDAPGPGNERPPEPRDEGAETGDQPRKRRRRRGGKRHRRRRERQAGLQANGEPFPLKDVEESDEDSEDSETSDEVKIEVSDEPVEEVPVEKAKAPEPTPRPRRTPPRAPQRASTPRKPARPASADKHLADDEPVEIPPPPRPRSVRDLDDIPDDFD